MTFQFERFTLDVESRRLTAGDRVVPLPPKEFDLLVTLLQARPRVVPKAELHEHLWPRTYVSDSSLAGLITNLREALDDDPKTPRFIRTVHRVGYAFVATASPQDTRAPSQTAKVAFWLTLPNRQFALTENENIIGCDPHANIILQFPGVSRRHARIVIGQGEAIVEDLGSKNGTLLRGHNVTAPSQLYDGDQVTFGSIVLTFRAPTRGPSSVTETVNEAKSSGKQRV